MSERDWKSLGSRVRPVFWPRAANNCRSPRALRAVQPLAPPQNRRHSPESCKRRLAGFGPQDLSSAVHPRTDLAVGGVVCTLSAASEGQSAARTRRTPKPAGAGEMRARSFRFATFGDALPGIAGAARPGTAVSLHSSGSGHALEIKVPSGPAAALRKNRQSKIGNSLAALGAGRRSRGGQGVWLDDS